MSGLFNRFLVRRANDDGRFARWRTDYPERVDRLCRELRALVKVPPTFRVRVWASHVCDYPVPVVKLYHGICTEWICGSSPHDDELDARAIADRLNRRIADWPATDPCVPLDPVKRAFRRIVPFVPGKG